MIKLWPLLNQCRFFMKCVFVLSFMYYTEDFNMHHMSGFCKSGVTFILTLVHYDIIMT